MNKAHLQFGQSSFSASCQSSVSSSGLFGFGLCAIFFNLFQAGLFPVDVTILAMGVFYGGVSQITVGLMEWHKNNFFGAAAFVSFGLFWLSLVGFFVLPEAGFGVVPDSMVLSAYFLLWGGFTLILFSSARQISRSVKLVLISLVAYFAIFSLGEATGSIMIGRFAAYCGLAGGCAALYSGTALIVNQVFGRTVLPGGQPR
ncbi:acetate uptake transporter [Trichloromonas sp.]|uniref:acetate uptake transporter n=1 Tax=Trichloromonas sp. TaxID=3069249 RepID=UPI003D817ADB